MDILLRRKLISLILFLIPFCASAQFNCETLVSEAEQAFEAGKYDSVTTNVERGLKECNLSRQERQKALELLVKTYIEKDNPEERDKAVVRLLQLNPNYKLTNPQSATSFNMAVQKYTVSPFISFGLGAGVNFPLTHIQTVYSILDGADYAKAYTPKVSFQTNVHLEADVWKYVSVCFEPGISTVAYSRTINGANDWKLTFTETQSNTDWIGYIKVGYPLKKFRVFAEVGYDYTTIRNSSADVELNYVAYNSITQTNDAYQIAANKIDLIKDNLRIRNTRSLVFGLGGSYRINNVIFSLDAKYLYSKDNLVDGNHRFQNKLLTFDYYYIDNDFDMNRVQVQGGISYVFFYMIKKRKILQ